MLLAEVITTCLIIVREIFMLHFSIRKRAAGIKRDGDVPLSGPDFNCCSFFFSSSCFFLLLT